LRGPLLAAIRFYKRRVSPHKGYGCAYRVYTGRCSCSTLGLRAISRFGAVRGLGVLRQRLAECHFEAVRRRTHRPLARQAQAGFVDCVVPCDGSCEALTCADGCDAVGGVMDVLSCGCDGCGGPWTRTERNRRTERRR
jgi:putative component of membrane protein insertase Oxa1/YidC/SpoIIIJ protein YidD